MTQGNINTEVTCEAIGEVAGKKPLLRIDESKMKAWVDGQVKNAVEDVLNDIMEFEAKTLAGAEVYERTEGRKIKSRKVCK